MQDSDPHSLPTIDIKDMEAFVREHAAIFPRLPEYLAAVDDILNSEDGAAIKNAYRSLQEFMEETGALVWIGGLTGVADKVASEFGKHI